MKRKILFKIAAMLGVVLLLTACEGILDGIYDNDAATTSGSEYGFVDVDEDNHSGTVYVNASEYTQWIYIDFHTQSIDSLEISDDMVEPENWDIAVHRYDAKTNGGAVLETDATDFATLLSASSIPSGTYVEDEWSQVTVDMSGMMTGDIGYADSYVNTVLSQWLVVDTSSMPPSYTLSGKVYMVKLSDGTYLALRLADFRSQGGTTGYLTIEYVYPFELN